MKTYVTTALVAATLLAIGDSGVAAQSVFLNLPDLSQHAQLMQRIGLTEITIDYHRPLARGRKIFGGLQPYGEVWRAGANFNTTIQFADPVTIEGQPLASGVYGLHFIPGASSWVAIFSKNSTSWGSFTYDQKEDALRVTVTPQPIGMQDVLDYRFDDPTGDACVLTMRWEHVAVPIRIRVDTPAIVAASLRKQLRGRVQTEWQAWEEAANYLLENHVNPEEAAGYAEKSVSIEDRFENEITRARALTALGHADDARAAQQKALTMGSEQQVYDFARTLQRLGQQDQAIAILRGNIARFPDTWRSHLERSRVAVAQPDYASAKAEMKKAMDAAPPDLKPALADLLRQLDAGVDINK
jgi:tetratricopeptide (TPR) repeat protein